MSRATRRGFIKIAGAGVAAAGVGSIGTAASAAEPATLADTAPAATALALPAAAQGSLVAYISDVRSGEIAVMVGGREVTVVDRQIVAKLAHALQDGAGPADA